jgi:hypothetical protein
MNSQQDSWAIQTTANAVLSDRTVAHSILHQELQSHTAMQSCIHDSTFCASTRTASLPPRMQPLCIAGLLLLLLLLWLASCGAAPSPPEPLHEAPVAPAKACSATFSQLVLPSYGTNCGISSAHRDACTR